jgi:hypothetical protein
MQPAGTFKQRVSIALKDVTLQASLGKLTREGLSRGAKAVASSRSSRHCARKAGASRTTFSRTSTSTSSATKLR